MAFLLYKKEVRDGKMFYINEHRNYQLAGYQLIYKLWVKKGKPSNVGWTITASELLYELNIEYSDKSHSLVIDFFPYSKEAIGLIEIEKIHLFTNVYDSVSWTPIMFELKDVHYDEEFEEELTPESKRRMIEEIEVLPVRNSNVEFLYLKGDSGSWNWGRNGSTNAAFIGGEARKYFKNFF